MDNNLFVNYNARCKEYTNIKCTKYVFKIENHLRMYWYFVKNINTNRYAAFKHFMTKNNIQEKIKSINKYDENLTNDYNIIC